MTSAFRGPAWRKRRLWEQSLSKESYAASEAADVKNMSERRIRALIKKGELVSTRVSKRNTLIPRQAIIDYMAPSPWEGILW
jgi:excisionase family DNA binding protein